MAAPNLLNPTTITGKTAVQAVGTSSSGKALKINALYVSNVDGTNNAEINVDVYRSSTAYHIGKTITVPADATLDVISKPIYLEEGDTLRLTANAASDLEAVCSYEEIS